MTRRQPTEYDWKTCTFDELIMEKHITVPRREKIQFVVIHHMAMVGKGDGKANDSCYKTWQTREASAHYGVDGKHVTQFVWDKDAAWATANTHGNHAGISIEHANSTAGPDWKVSTDTWKTGARLVANLHVLYKLGRPVAGKTLRKHKDFFSTACPGPFLGGTNWDAYVKEAQVQYDRLAGVVPPKDEEPVVTKLTMPPLEDPRLFEFSGAVRSVRNPGHFWAIVDENAPIRLVREKDMKIIKSFILKGVKLIDPEALAYDPINKTINVWDGGDNDSNRKNVIIYSFREPALDAPAELDSVAIKLTYSNGAKKISTNAEALVCHPLTGRLVFSKTNPSRVYHQQGTTLMLKLEPLLSFPTDAEISPDGKHLYIIRKDHDAIEVYDTNTFTHLGSLPHKDSKQPEALWWHSNGTHLLVGSEKSPTVIAVEVPGKWR